MTGTPAHEPATVPRVIEIDDGEAAIGHIVAHGEAQFDAFDITGRPIGTFAEFPAAASAVRRAQMENLIDVTK